MNQIIAILIQIIFVLIIAPFASGLVRFFKARLQGRKGASPFLPYITLATLLRKEMVISETTSWIFRVVPFVVLSSVIFLSAVIPLIFSGISNVFMSDFLVIAGILSIGSIFLVLGGLDAGSAFGGMGSSREMTISALLEPVIIMIFATVSFVTKEFTIDGMLTSPTVFAPYLILTIIALILVALAENARYPVDNPDTHLELTMVHEAMLLEYSGKYLALLEYASSIKLVVFSLLIANFIFPLTLVGASSWGIGGLVIGLCLSLIKIIIAMFTLAFLESILVKMRFYRMSEYFSIAFVVAFLGMVIALLTNIAGIIVQYHSLFAIFSVICVAILFGRVRLKAILRYYAVSSLALAGVAWGLIPLVPEAEKINLWLFAIFTIITKVWAVPYVINRSSHAKKSLTNLPSFLRPGKSYFLAIIILIATYFILENISITGLEKWNALIYASVALIVLGIAMMIIKRNVFSQIVGLLVIENGIAVFVLATIGSLPIVIEFGVFAVAVATAYILSILSAQIGELYGSIDTEDLCELTE
ncbi:MAG: Hydrogenase subunit [Candidatus Moranbacteria bacterium GW2011_GWF2_36_839]|nr:MAG: Hydrogenase subunit [Candidatus Moranbacteria bacterium GW2011_GWF1_36_78]KKQ16582.1 MAG: Hydrogenase subunit [Candidatus Moranbacteria bacterium GW2011_GWF2_36_839]